MTVLGYAGLLLFAGWLLQAAGAIAAVLGSRRLHGPLPEREPTTWPAVSIVVPARNEVSEVEAAISGLLALDYPQFEVIAIDDRSTDGTGAILDRLSAADPRCRVLHVTALPPGWLGKNHALHRGAAVATGRWLVFTDADVHWAPDALRRAVHFAERRGLDHLVLVPGSPARSPGEELLMTYFEFLFFAATGFGLVRHRWLPRAYVGIGAFNLVRREVYDAIGGHEALRMQVVDDVQLGKRIKSRGFLQDATHGRPFLSVYWQRGVRGIVRGLEKNAFAVTGYSVLRTTWGALAQLAASVVPPTLTVWLLANGVVEGSGARDALADLVPWLAWSALAPVVLAGVARANGYRARWCLLHPLAASIFAYALLRSMVRTMAQGGVVWRDSHYPLRDLRDHHF